MSAPVTGYAFVKGVQHLVSFASAYGRGGLFSDKAKNHIFFGKPPVEIVMLIKDSTMQLLSQKNRMENWGVPQKSNEHIIGRVFHIVYMGISDLQEALGNDAKLLTLDLISRLRPSALDDAIKKWPEHVKSNQKRWGK
jgi:hypothetical protein